MTPATVAAGVWRTARGAIPLDRPRIAGILNLTPDSFWDGGRHAAGDAALRRADRLLEEGADLLDLGGESSRPGARPITAEEELRRVVPVVEAVARRHPGVPISVDTTKAAVAEAALAAGAAIINDVSALRLDPALAHVVAAAGAGLVLMHSRGGIAEMASYDAASYGPDPVADIAAELAPAIARARYAGVADAGIVIDPGLGFSKRTAHSVAALQGVERLASAGFPLMVGPSRKRFLGELAGGLPAGERLEATLAASVFALLHGVRLFRLHDVAAGRRALDTAHALGTVA
jgi:dihydropteroate synthase